MAKKVQKYYVVWKGVKPGIYASWEQCQQQIKGFQQAYYKAFPTLEQAQIAFAGNMWKYIGKNADEAKGAKSATISREAKLNSWSVDAACSGNPGVMEYQGVITGTGQRIFYGGPYPDATNNIGEFLALVHALAMLKQKGLKQFVYSDSKTAMAWVRNKKAKTLLQETPRNAKVFELIERAEEWLKNNTYDTTILKWDTKNWGEIPADFGRK
jgi:ribonuclease HI